MRTSLSYVLITPYAISKGRAGGILSRLLFRTDLGLVGARMFVADDAFAKKYAQALRERSPKALLADYVERNLANERSLLLLFQGQNPCEQLCGTRQPGETIQGIYGDLILSPENPDEVIHFEPAVLTAKSQAEADEDLRLMADFFDGKGNVVSDLSYPDPSKIERTLVILKPDNWTFNSLRPGAIMDMFSGTGLRIIGVKVHHFSLAQALDFYGPVEAALKKKLSGMFGKKAVGLLEREFQVSIGEETAKAIAETFGVDCALNEFAQLVEFMCGKRPDDHSRDEPGNAKCMILIYEGENAVAKIRETLGPTNPADAPSGTVRREFGQSVMVNTAHASDSPESFLREKDIVKIEENTIGAIIRAHI